MNARDELARDWAAAFNSDTPVVEYLHAAGYRKPRTITTLEELDALKLPAIIDCKNGGVAKVEYMYGPGRQKYAEFLFGEADESHSLAELADWALPAQVLKEATA